MLRVAGLFIEMLSGVMPVVSLLNVVALKVDVILIVLFSNF
jgi:hypothetical protein